MDDETTAAQTPAQTTAQTSPTTPGVVTTATVEALGDLLRLCVAEGVGLGLAPVPAEDGGGWQVGWLSEHSGDWVTRGDDLTAVIASAGPKIVASRG